MAIGNYRILKETTKCSLKNSTSSLSRVYLRNCWRSLSCVSTGTYLIRVAMTYATLYGNVRLLSWPLLGVTFLLLPLSYAFHRRFARGSQCVKACPVLLPVIWPWRYLKKGTQRIIQSGKRTTSCQVAALPHHHIVSNLLFIYVFKIVKLLWL